MAAVAPPTPQEIQRKLSLHSPTPPKRTPSGKRVKKLTTALSGTESDSDSGPALSATAPADVGASQPPLSAISERMSVVGEETDDEDEEEDGEEDGEWRASTGLKEKDKGTNEETVLKSGYLWKKGERRKTWKKRWFVLRPDKLSYYKNDREYQLHRLLELNDVHSVSPVSLKKHTNTFGIVTPTRTFYIQASSPSDCDGWVKALNEVRTQLKDSSSTPTLPIPIPQPRGRNPLTLTPATPPPSSSPPIPPPPPSPQAYHMTSSDSDDPFTVGSSSSPRSIVRDPQKAVLSGYLMKCGSKRKNWRKRWFVLTSEKLIYAKSHMDNKPHREIPLSAIVDAIEYTLPPKLYQSIAHHSITPSTPVGISQSLASASQGDTTIADPAHTFKIITPKRPFLLCAPSEEEEIKWLSAVRALIARRTTPADDPPKTESKGMERSRSHGATSIINSAGDSPSKEGASVRLVEKRRSVSASGSGPPVSLEGSR